MFQFIRSFNWLSFPLLAFIQFLTFAFVFGLFIPKPEIRPEKVQKIVFKKFSSSCQDWVGTRRNRGMGLGKTVKERGDAICPHKEISPWKMESPLNPAFLKDDRYVTYHSTTQGCL